MTFVIRLNFLDKRKYLSINFFILFIQRVMETIMILLSGTQLFCMCAIHAGVEDTVRRGLWKLINFQITYIICLTLEITYIYVFHSVLCIHCQFNVYLFLNFFFFTSVRERIFGIWLEEILNECGCLKDIDCCERNY